MEEENGRKQDSLLLVSIIILIQVLTLYLIMVWQHSFDFVYNYI